MPCSSRCHRISSMMSSDVIIDTASCLPSRPPSRPRPVIISYRIPDDIATQSITGDTRYDDTRLPLISPPISSPYCFQPRFPPHRVAQRVGSKHDAILHTTRFALSLPACSPCFISSASSHLIGSSVPPVACLPRPTHAVAIHLIHLIGSSLRLIISVQSDETSDEQAKRRTGRAIDNEQAERHDIRHLDDNANTPPRPPYSPYEPYDAQIPTREHARGKTPLHEPHNAPDGQYGMRGRDETTGRRLLAYRRDDEATTPPLAYRHDNGTPDATANCYPPHDTTTQDE